MSNKAKSKSLEIAPLEYDGSVNEFRAWMDGFLSSAGSIMLATSASQEEIRQRAFDEWEKGGKEGHIINMAQYYPRLIVMYSEIDQSSNREVWYVAKYDPIHEDETKPPQRWATILAIQTFNHTVVQFLDGKYFRLRESKGRVTDYARTIPIGDSFSKYAQYIKDEWEKQLNTTVDERQRGSSGRPHLPADIWAWEQVNEQKQPMNQVYQEWLARDDVVARKLQDPRRHFNRITKPGWGTK